MFNGWNNEGAADMFGSMMKRQGATQPGQMMAGGLKRGGGTMGGYGATTPPMGGGPYDPTGKPGTISGAVPMGKMGSVPGGGVPNPRNYNPVNPGGGYQGSYGAPEGGPPPMPQQMPGLQNNGPLTPEQQRQAQLWLWGGNQGQAVTGGGPYNPFGKPGPISGAVPKPPVEDFVPRPRDITPVDGPARPPVEDFVPRPNNVDEPPPSDGNYGSAQRMPKRGGWDWRQNPTPDDQNYINQRQAAYQMPQFQPEPQFQQPQQNQFGVGMGGWPQMMSPWNY